MRRQPRPVTRDPRARQLPTVPSHAVPTRECQSDPPSLLWTIRCSRPRGQPLDRASPLTFCSMSERCREGKAGRRRVPKSRAGARADAPPGVAGFARAFIGRDGELERLHAAYRRAVERRRPVLVTILGDAGVGKTRLVRELWERLAAEEPEPLRRTG